MADPNNANGACVETVAVKVAFDKSAIDIANKNFEICLSLSKEDAEAVPICIDIWAEVKQIVECCLAEKCPINGGTITYAEGPGVLVDNSAGFVLTDKDGVAQPTEYCVTDGNSGRDEKWIVLKETGPNSEWQWHQLT